MTYLLKTKVMIDRKGEPEIIIYNNSYIIVEMSTETPNDRSICYDMEARVNRKKFPPPTSALEIADKNGLLVVDEDLYQYLQTLKMLDTKTSSWLKTNDAFRALGGAITGERRYNRIFIYHNGADSYYDNQFYLNNKYLYPTDDLDILLSNRDITNAISNYFK